jgi:DNA-binding winged helix-turn-helix (wHTH) protein
MRVSFGSCVVDTATREVLRDGRPIHLTPLAFRLLELLLEQRPRALTKADLQDALWPETFVSEASLSGLVADLRSAIGDDARGARFIRTVHRFGYAFAGEVEVLAARSAAREGRSYRLIYLGRELALAGGRRFWDGRAT